MYHVLNKKPVRPELIKPDIVKTLPKIFSLDYIIDAHK